MDVPPATALAYGSTLSSDQLATVTTAGLQQAMEGSDLTYGEKLLQSLLSFFTCLAVTFPKCNCVRQGPEQPHLSPLVFGDGRCCSSTALARSSRTVLPASHPPRRQRRQHGPHAGNTGKIPLSQLKAKTPSQPQMEAHVMRSCSRTRRYTHSGWSARPSAV